ncbi:hypothetical protein ACS2BX_25780 [Bacillus cereus group sp. BceL300]|uniref:hypothetical protein n=1 Tax=Bacillus cereus group TaxID=86661 RepID=UPI001443C2CB|nr:hypothetical protein [Bacillus cereus]NKW77394.1 hypothetical protein [Bacillus cereus]NKX14811.1 hypothetical protein [Bacillus cereus]HDR8003370.1 hypothetical protein [Bacillus cereus]HDR8014916.1 hypothetical protein [Bacillus cereus]
MQLRTTVVITEVVKKTKAKGFENIKVGDKVTLTWGLGGGYHGAPYVGCYVNGTWVDSKNADTICKLFTYNEANFKYEEVAE